MNKYMFEAIKEAEKGIFNGEGGPFGAVIVKDDKIIGRGHNQVLFLKDPTCHGEIMAIHDASRNIKSHDLSGTVIYTTGEPCPMCLGAILWANIDHVYYGASIKDTNNIGFRDEVFYDKFNSKNKDNTTELDREECLKLYDKYSSLNHNLY